MSIFKKAINKVKSTISGKVHLVKFRETKYASQFLLKLGRETIGSFDLSPNDIREFEGKRYQSILLPRIQKKYRGKGYGTIMYKEVLKSLPDDIDGLFSEPYTRHNKEQVPRIHQRLGGRKDENGVVYIDK